MLACCLVCVVYRSSNLAWEVRKNNSPRKPRKVKLLQATPPPPPPSPLQLHNLSSHQQRHMKSHTNYCSQSEHVPRTSPPPTMKDQHPSPNLQESFSPSCSTLNSTRSLDFSSTGSPKNVTSQSCVHSGSSGYNGSSKSGRQTTMVQEGGPTWADRVKGSNCHHPLCSVGPQELSREACSSLCSLDSDITKGQPEWKREETEEEGDWKKVTRGRLKSGGSKRSEGFSGKRSGARVVPMEGGDKSIGCDCEKVSIGSGSERGRGDEATIGSERSDEVGTNGSERSVHLTTNGSERSGGDVATNRSKKSGGEVATNRSEKSGGDVATNRSEKSGEDVATNRPEKSGGDVASYGEQRWVEEMLKSRAELCEEEEIEIGDNRSNGVVERGIVEGEEELTGVCEGGEQVEDKEIRKGGGVGEGCEENMEEEEEAVLVEEGGSVCEAEFSGGEERNPFIPELDMAELQTRKERAYLFIKPENVSRFFSCASPTVTSSLFLLV